MMTKISSVVSIVQFPGSYRVKALPCFYPSPFQQFHYKFTLLIKEEDEESFPRFKFVKLLNECEYSFKKCDHKQKTQETKKRCNHI